MKGYDDFFEWLENSMDAQDALEQRQIDAMVDFARENGFHITLEEVLEFLNSLGEQELEDLTFTSSFFHTGYLN